MEPVDDDPQPSGGSGDDGSAGGDARVSRMLVIGGVAVLLWWLLSRSWGRGGARGGDGSVPTVPRRHPPAVQRTPPRSSGPVLAEPPIRFEFFVFRFDVVNDRVLFSGKLTLPTGVEVDVSDPNADPRDWGAFLGSLNRELINQAERFEERELILESPMSQEAAPLLRDVIKQEARDHLTRNNNAGFDVRWEMAEEIRARMGRNTATSTRYGR